MKNISMMVPLHLLGKSMIEGVCKSGRPSEHCRYYSEEEGKAACLKLSSWRQDIDKEVELFLREPAYDSYDLPTGDNCGGCEPPLSALLN